MKVLICDFDHESGDTLAHALQFKGHSPTYVSSLRGLDNYLQSLEEIFDFIVVDPTELSEPTSLVRKIYSLQPDAGIIYMQEELVSPSKEIELLHLGVTSVFPKNIQTKLLIYRLEAISKIAGKKDSDIPSRIGPFKFDWLHSSVQRQGGEIEFLTMIERKIVELLVSNVNTVVPYDTVVNQVYGHLGGDTKLLKAHIHHIRTKMEKDPSNPQYIQTLRGVGYSFQYQPDEVDSQLIAKDEHELVSA